MSRLTRNILLIFFGLFISVSLVFAEDFTITTYYPSPYGSYKQLSVSGQDDVINAGGSNIGSIDISHPDNGSASAITFKSTTNWPSDGGYIAYYDDNNTYNYWGDSVENSALVLGVTNDGQNANSDVVVLKSPAAAIIDAPSLIVVPTGNLGVGVTSPLQKLHVAGNIMGAAPGGTNTWYLDRQAGVDPWVRLYTSGGVYNSLAVGPFWANGASRFDLAEVTPVREKETLEVGDVVCIDKEAKVRMRRSQKAYDPLVAGIVSDPSTASMVIGGDTTPEKINSINDKKPIGLCGRVLCKVCAENGPIEIGDLLVTSSKPGYAMKASRGKIKPGMVLGKAMESLKEGEGKIIVWITLQ